MTEAERRGAARQFAADWQGRGDEKQETQRFWLSLLRNVFGVEQPERVIEFEKRVVVVNNDGTSTTKYIDGYMPETRVLIEQKGAKIDLKKGERQSDGAMLTPFQQGRRYGGSLPLQEAPRWVVACNFQTFEIHDMNRPNDAPEVLLLENLENEYHRLGFLLDTGNENVKKEMAVSLQAGELVGVLYEALLKQYKDPEDEETLKSLNALCVRLVFCLYAEDAGIFGGKAMFHDYIQAHSAEPRDALIKLFKILDTPEDNRDPYLDDDLLAFPYVNGGLFADENIIIPRLTDEIVQLILTRASGDFDWSGISPTIFGAVFESTLNPETRRKGGMHYTSIENIHKVIDPLFLDDLKAELTQVLSNNVERTRQNQLKAFQRKLSELTFLDPACGSGNFLTETYISLRRLENQVISELNKGQIVLDMGNPIQVSIGQFYGVEINDFAVTVAKTALWIAESQMMHETEDVVHMSLDFLPLKSYTNIVEGNALRLDWPKTDYIMGNPPFVGYTLQSPEQKADLQAVMPDAGKNIDYVSGWYFKAAQLMQGTDTRAAFVATNSVTQGEQVAVVWKPLFDNFGIHIDFAHRTFRWDSEASLKAHVHCVIVGFSTAPSDKPKVIYTSDRPQTAENINAYLLDAPSVFIESRKVALCDAPKIKKGSIPVDGGNLLLEDDEYEDFIQKEPNAKKYLRPFLGAQEYLHGQKRWCLWLKNANPSEIRNMPLVMNRISKVKEFREESTKKATQKYAEFPSIFMEIRQPSSEYIIIPSHSSEKRKYIPLSFISPNNICGNANLLIEDAGIYHFGILISNVHMAWVRAVCGRIKSDYRYSNDIVYNNFPWPEPTDAQKTKIEQTAQAILDARALYPDSSLADLYDETTMPPELRKAHQDNDKAVMAAYGFSVRDMTESSCVAELMKMYQALAEK